MCTFRRFGLSCETPALGPPWLHTTARELQTCTFEGPGLQKHHQNSTKPPREEERMKIVAGDGKKERNFGRSSGGRESGRGSGGGRVKGSAQILGGSDTPQHTTPHNTTGDPAQGGLGQGGSLAGRSMAQKTRHEQQIVPKTSPIGQGFWGQGWFAKFWAQNGLIQKKGPRGGLGQKWCGPKMVRAQNVQKNSKNGKTITFFKKPSPLHPKQRTKKKSIKNGKNLSPPTSQTKKSKKKSKIEKCLGNQIKILLKQGKIQKSENVLLFHILFLLFLIFKNVFCIFLIVLMFWDFGQPKTFALRKNFLYPTKSGTHLTITFAMFLQNKLTPVLHCTVHPRFCKNA